MKSKAILGMVVLFTTALVCSCNKNNGSQDNPREKDLPIVILYDNDVHCGTEGYPKIAGLRDAILAADTANVAIVSSGDYVMGGLIGTFSHGKYIIKLMNAAGYDVVTLGNHEFDYAAGYTMEMMGEMSAEVTNVNIRTMDTHEPLFKPYAIKQFGKHKIGFVGVLTPQTLSDAGLSFFDEDGNQLYDLSEGEISSLTQAAVDEARSKGADYVIVLAHLGEKDGNYLSSDLIAQTSGIDAVLDGHTHSVIEREYLPNKNGAMVLRTQTGTSFENIGKLYISKEGKLTTTLIPTADITETNAAVADMLAGMNAEIDEVTGTVYAESEQKMSIYNSEGVRIVRKEECTVGNFVCDVLAAVGGEDAISIYIGGGIRSDIPEGEVTYADLMKVTPYDNPISIIKVKGSQLFDILENGVKSFPAEDGEFMQVSEGIRYTFNSASTPRIQTVEIKKKGSFMPLDPDAEYTMCVNSFVILNIKGKYTVIQSNMGMPYEVIPAAIKEKFGGRISSRYAHTEGRISGN